jgi:hypothetical protein
MKSVLNDGSRSVVHHNVRSVEPRNDEMNACLADSKRMNPVIATDLGSPDGDLIMDHANSLITTASGPMVSHPNTPLFSATTTTTSTTRPSPSHPIVIATNPNTLEWTPDACLNMIPSEQFNLLIRRVHELEKSIQAIRATLEEVRIDIKTQFSVLRSIY